MAFHVLERDREGGKHLSNALSNAVERIGNCPQCRDFTELKLCKLCSNEKRDKESLCVVESPTDVIAIEQATDYRGLYFVLGGRLSPLDNIGPTEIGLDVLETRLDDGKVKELILATTTTVEGEATAHYISQIIRDKDIPVTRIAHGVPLGGELEFVDSGTLAHAFAGRKEIRGEGGIDE
tara:strand:- start:7266 stop:7805 length:540 start_codon:yes stop_codon:yes gene_type:complete